MDDEKNKSLHFTTGLLLGTAVAAGATFLYKTKKGKLARKIFQHHLKDIVDDIKTKAEAVVNINPETKIIKKQLTKEIKSVAAVAKRVFFKSGKPLVK
ncbi:MAG: YtxH domain-containing protein [Patescibacteria group bacterium]